MSSEASTPTIGDVIHASGIVFGTSGARGLVSDLSDETCAAFVLAFVSVARRRFDFDRVAVGWDLRPSSPRIAAAAIAAIQAAGLKVDFCGMLPTPALALHAMAQRIPAVMVTGSHIPFDRNGLKFYRPDGEIDKDDELAILSNDLPLPEVKFQPQALSIDPTASATYVRRYLTYFQPNLLQDLRIGLYQHSSASRDLFAEILNKLGADVVVLGRTDTFVPIDTEAVSEEDAARGREWAAQHRLDALLSTDGDGDRPLVGDDRGEWLRGDIVGLLCARALGIDALAVPVSCNTAIERCGSFRIVERTRIGSPHVIAAMDRIGGKENRVAGFEANGGFLLGCRLDRGSGELAPLPTRDAVLPALAVIAAARDAGTTLSELAAALPSRHTASDRLQGISMERSRQLLARFAKDPAALLAIAGLGASEPGVMDTTDGLRLTTRNDEIVHLRPSGNAPELRCYSEADTPERARRLVATILGGISADRG